MTAIPYIAIAALSEADTKTVRRYFRSVEERQRMKGASRRRIESAIARLGIADPLTPVQREPQP